MRRSTWGVSDMMRSARAGTVSFMLLGALAGCSDTNAYSNRQLSLAPVEPEAGPAEASDSDGQPIWPANPECFRRARPWGGKDGYVLALTLSGGGSRAAVFGAAVMLELQDIGVLDKVDLVSSVSGGSLAAALYALSHDPAQPESESDWGAQEPKEQNREPPLVWSRDTVLEMTSKNLLAGWILRWLRPDSIFKYWFTSYDRTDIFADMLNSQLLSGLGKDLGYPTFADLNSQRVTLILNATNFTQDRNTDVFTFTPWDFAHVLSSDICSYDVARGVSASAAFPGVFQYSTLRNFNDKDKYVDLMDGGATDNLGIKGLDRTLGIQYLCGQTPPAQRDIEQNPSPPVKEPCRKLLVLVIDAQNGFEGRDPAMPDPRGLLDRFFDTNFLDAYDTLMQTGYGQLLRQFRQDIEDPRNYDAGLADGTGVLNLSLLALIHDGWDGYDGQYTSDCPEVLSARPPDRETEREQFAAKRACELGERARDQVTDMLEGEEKSKFRNILSNIGTNWRIEPDQVACLEVAAYALVKAAQPELKKFFEGSEDLKPQDLKPKDAEHFARIARSRNKCLEGADASL